MATGTRSSTRLLTINTDVPEYLRCATHCEDILKCLRGRQDLCDVVLIVGDSGKRICAHRQILIASSDYFSALLSGGMRESQEREITLSEVDGDSLEKLVNFYYTGCLELRGATIEALLTTANYLQLKKVIEACCDFLQRHLQPSNCLGIGFFAEQLDLEALLKSAKKLIYEKFEEVSNHNEFFLLNAEQLSILIGSDDLFVLSEEFVFHFVMKWIEYEPDNRRKHFTDLLAQVRLPLLPLTFLTEIVQPLCNTTESQTLVLNSLKSHLMPSSESFVQHRKDYRNLLCIYESKTPPENTNLAIAGYNLRTKVWTTWNIPIENRSFSAVTLMDDNLIVVGGLLIDSILNIVTGLNLYTMASAEIPPLGTSRIEHVIAVLNGSVYAIGGYDGCQLLNSVERWDPANKTWSYITPMKKACRRSAVAAFDHHLYVSGGHYDYSTSIECYDPVKNIWSSKAPLKVGRHSHCLAAHNGYLFAIGGQKCINTNDIPIERYDPRSDKWTTISCSPNICGDTRCTSLGPDIFIYNKDNIYTISKEGSCDNLKLQILPTTIPCLKHYSFTDLVVTPYDFSPPESWIKDKKFEF